MAKACLGRNVLKTRKELDVGMGALEEGAVILGRVSWVYTVDSLVASA